MRPETVTVDSMMPMEEFRARFPLGSKTQVIAVDAEGRYAGLALILVVVALLAARAADADARKVLAPAGGQPA